MNPISVALGKLARLFRRERFRSELDEEMAFHRAQAEKDFLAGGMTPEAARRAAALQFGSTAKLREQSQEIVGFRAETVAQDMRTPCGSCERIQDLLLPPSSFSPWEWA